MCTIMDILETTFECVFPLLFSFTLSFRQKEEFNYESFQEDCGWFQPETYIHYFMMILQIRISSNHGFDVFGNK